MNKRFITVSMILVLSLAGCSGKPQQQAPSEVQIIVQQTVEVTREVVKEITREVTREVVREIPQACVETEVTRLVVVTPTAEPTALPLTAAPLQPQDARASAFICANESPNLPDGEPGKLSVLASFMEVSAGWGSTTVLLIIRNNTTTPVTFIEVSAAAYTADGKLFATGGDQGFTPKYTGPGEIAMGYAYFSDAEVPRDARIEYEINARSVPVGADQGDFVVEECSVVEGRVLGFLRNDGKGTISGPISVHVYCFDETGSILGMRGDFTDKDEAAPGGRVPYQVSLYDDPCPIYLVTGSGFTW